MYTLWKKEEEYIPNYEEKKKSTANNKEAIAAKENTDQTQAESPSEKAEKSCVIVEKEDVLSDVVNKKGMTMKNNRED
jgi:ABC-type uncharacterized transport system involved in gliding motility auxiliary subunit